MLGFNKDIVNWIMFRGTWILERCFLIFVLGESFMELGLFS